MTEPTTCRPQVATADDGTVLRACSHGGHLLGWHPGGVDGAGEQLWLSPLARCGPGEAIRGGVPVIFPQFAGRGPLPKHGVARDRPWRLTCTTVDGEAAVDAVLTDDEATRAIWPHRFTLTLRVRATGPRLSITLTVRNDDLAPGSSPSVAVPPHPLGDNPSGDDPFRFTSALHTYLAVEAAEAATVEGLPSAPAEDNAAHGAPIRLPDGPFEAWGPRDVAVPGHAGPVAVVEPGRRVELTRDGFDDLVVWNPGPDHGLADVPVAGAHHFVCIEAAQLAPITLAAGQEWSATAHYQVTPTRQ
jgi:glucose-6-phosphate 1-epimerase